MTESGGAPVGAPFTVYYQAPDGDTAGDIATCVPVASDADFDDKLEVFTWAEGPVASIIHEGSYEDMGRSYATVSAWIQERGHQVVGPAREIYLNSQAEVEESELRTEIQFPIDTEGQS